MFKLEYTLKEGPEGKLVLRFKWGVRILMMLFALIVLGSILLGSRGEGGLTFLPHLFFIFFLIASLYDERWIVDTKQRFFTHRHGLMYPLIPAKRHAWSFNEIESLELSQFKTRKKMIRLSLVLKRGDRKDIEIADRKELEDVEKRGGGIAAAMGLSLHKDLKES